MEELITFSEKILAKSKKDFKKEKIELDYIVGKIKTNPLKYIHNYNHTRGGNSIINNIATLSKSMTMYYADNCVDSLLESIYFILNRHMVKIEGLLPYLISNEFMYKYGNNSKKDILYGMKLLRCQSLLDCSFNILHSTDNFNIDFIKKFKNFNNNPFNISYIKSYSDNRLWRKEGCNYTRLSKKTEKNTYNQGLYSVPNNYSFSQGNTSKIEILKAYIGSIKEIRAPLAYPLDIHKNRLYLLLEFNKDDLRLVQFNSILPFLRLKNISDIFIFYKESNNEKLLYNFCNYNLIGLNNKKEVVAVCGGKDLFVYPYAGLYI